jgi:hypothetical protein
MRHDVAAKRFDDGILVFQAADASMLKVNDLAYELLNALDGNTTVAAITQQIASRHETPIELVKADILAIIADFEAKRIIKRCVILPFKKGSTCMASDVKYLCNPDVSLRIEDDDGAILFCPDTVATQIINPIGLEIWESLSTPHTKAEIVAHLIEVCEGAPEDEIADDVNAFISRLYSTGFIGKVDAHPHDTE